MINNYIFKTPVKDIFTIYTKDKCSYCTRVKLLLEDKNIEYITINCDGYICENREAFLEFVKELTKKDYKTFPIVFNEKCEFIGGFVEIEKYIEKSLDFVEDF